MPKYVTDFSQMNGSQEVSSVSGALESVSTVRNPDVPSCAHQSVPLVSNLGQMNPINIIPYYFSKIHFNIIFLSMYR
jgi:hypothetical protein